MIRQRIPDAIRGATREQLHALINNVTGATPACDNVELGDNTYTVVVPGREAVPIETPNMETLHIFGHAAWHDEAYIVGNEAGLTRLLDAIDKALEEGYDYLHEKQQAFLFQLIKDEDAASELSWDIEEKDIQDMAEEILKRPFTDDELDDIYHAKSRELKVIVATVLLRNESGQYLPGTICDMTRTFSIVPEKFLLDLIDPVIYVMQFSLFSNKDLRNFEYMME